MRLSILFALLLLCEAGLYGSVVVGGTDSTSKEIRLSYIAPDTGACQITTSPAANDVDTTKFAGSNLDTRDSALVNGRNRLFVLGKDFNARVDSSTIVSRALKADTDYTITIGCGAGYTDTKVLTVRTKTVPVGLTRGEALPADPDNPGGYLIPTRDNTNGQKIITPFAGVEVTYPTTQTLGAAPASAVDTCTRFNVPGPSNAPGKLCNYGNDDWRWTPDDTSQPSITYGTIMGANQTSGAWPVSGKGGDNHGFLGINPNYPKRAYYFDFFYSGGGYDTKIQVIDYTGDYSAPPTKAANYYYAGYLGAYTYSAGNTAQVLPNCAGQNKFQPAATLALIASEGYPCTQHWLALSSARSQIETFGEQRWRLIRDNINNLDLAAWSVTYSATYDVTTQKVYLVAVADTSTDSLAIAYVFRIDDGNVPTVAPTATLIAEVPSWTRRGARVTVKHGGAAVNPYAPMLKWFGNPPMGIQGIQYFDTTSVYHNRGPYWATYTAVNGNSGAYATNTSGGSGLISCAPWAFAPNMPSPVPDGSTTYRTDVYGTSTLVGCTTFTLDRSFCDTSLTTGEQNTVNLDAATHNQRCGGANRLWPGVDIEVGDKIGFPKTSGTQTYSIWEHGEVVGVSGTGPGMQITVLRGNTTVNQLGNFNRGAQSYNSGNSAKALYWSYNFNNDDGLQGEQQVDFLNYPTGLDGGYIVPFFPSHGNITEKRSAGNSGTDYVVQDHDPYWPTVLTKALPDYKMTNVPKFEGKSINDGNAMETHVSQTASNLDLGLFDGRPWTGHDGVAPDGPGTNGVASGTTTVYRWSKTRQDSSIYSKLYPKFLPKIGASGYRVMRDISGPTIGDVITDATPFTMCYAYRAGECRSDSAKDDFFMSVPDATVFMAKRFCCGTYGYDTKELSFTSATVANTMTQVLVRNDQTGRTTRMLTNSLDRYKTISEFWNAAPVNGGRTLVTHTNFDDLSGGMVPKFQVTNIALPETRVDSFDRTVYMKWPIQVPAYSGADNAIIEFGYRQYGDPNLGQLRCMDRAENCVAAAGATSTDPFWFAHETYSGVACTSGCIINVPLVGNEMLYYRIVWRSGTTAVFTGPVSVLATP